MAIAKISSDQGGRNRKLVLAEILRQPGISRTQIADAVALNAASVSRISRDLIAAGLISESESFGPKDRPGRKFVGLKPRGEGGFIIGIGMNGFRQSVTLANLENEKVAEWVSPETPGTDGEAFLRLCLGKARDMLDQHVPDRGRFFGVGIAIAAELDREALEIIQAPVFGWEKPIQVGNLVSEILGAPLTLDSPASAINKAEADCGIARKTNNLVTLHCSLGFGLGARRRSDAWGEHHEINAVLVQSEAPDGSGRSLTDAFGGASIIFDHLGKGAMDGKSDTELGAVLVDLIEQSATNEQLRSLLSEKGAQTARCFSLVFDLCQPDKILLAGPLANSDAFVAGFGRILAKRPNPCELDCSQMTPTGASRWLALRGNVAEADLNLEALKIESAA